MKITTRLKQVWVYGQYLTVPVEAKYLAIDETTMEDCFLGAIYWYAEEPTFNKREGSWQAVNDYTCLGKSLQDIKVDSSDFENSLVKLPEYAVPTNPKFLEDKIMKEDLDLGFKSQVEILQYLIDGGEVKGKHSLSTYKVIEGEIRNGKGVIISIFDKVTDYTKAPNWEANIPEQGVLCFGWDLEGDTKELILVSKVTNGLTYSYRSKDDDSFYKFAEPVTEETIKEYLWKG